MFPGHDDKEQAGTEKVVHVSQWLRSTWSTPPSTALAPDENVNQYAHAINNNGSGIVVQAQERQEARLIRYK
jgi:hypothetical protein